MMAAGMLVGVVVAVQRARRVAIEPAVTLDLCFYAVVFGMLGARLLYVLTHAAQYARLCLEHGAQRGRWQRLVDCTAPLQFWQGGLVFLGGAVLAAGATMIQARRKQLEVGLVADVLAPSVSIAHVFGRMGCLMAGCCYGKPWPGGLHFPPGSVAYTELLASGVLLAGAATTPGLHPTQIYEAAGELLIFVFLLQLWRRRHAPGSIALAYGLTYGALRFAMEVLRGDKTRGFLLHLRIPALAHLLGLPASEDLLLSSAQATALLLMAACAIMYIRLRHRPSREQAAGGP
jgi:phosphatidylglycerol:prolipoprotein diacylglycerol transferase